MSDSEQVAFAMSFLDTIQRAKTYLEEQGRVSLSALKLEFDLDDARLESLIEELVEVQQIAAREGQVLAWVGPARAKVAVAEPLSVERAPRDYTPGHLADQILLPLAMSAWQGGGGGRFRTLALTEHSTTHMEVLRKFLDDEIAVERRSSDDVTVEVRRPTSTFRS